LAIERTDLDFEFFGMRVSTVTAGFFSEMVVEEIGADLYLSPFEGSGSYLVRSFSSSDNLDLMLLMAWMALGSRG